VKKKEIPSAPSWALSLSRRPQALWGIFGLAAWSVQQVLHSQRGEPFSFPLYVKGALLIGAAAFLFDRWQKKELFFLGMFPLLWMSFSRAQWEICSPAGQPYWNWLALFLLSEILLLTLVDGRKLLLLLAPVWLLQTHLFRFSLLLPLSFLRLPAEWTSPLARFKGWLTREEHLSFSHWGKGRKGMVLWLVWVLTWVSVLFAGFFLAWWVPAALFPMAFLAAPRDPLRRRVWLGWGGALAALALFLGYRAWTEFSFDWSRTWTFFVEERYLSFFLLSWLGLASLPRQGVARLSVFTIFPLTLGCQFWPGPEWAVGGSQTLLLWVLLLFAGVGWESFRVYLMDPSWHGRLVWLVLGLCLLAGVV